jgi:hypothetical protein
MAPPEVTVYSRAHGPPWVRARALLPGKGLAVEEIAVEGKDEPILRGDA